MTAHGQPSARQQALIAEPHGERSTALPTMAFVHGLAGSAATTWQANGWLDVFADAGFRSWAIDLPAHGDGPHSHDPEDYHDLSAGLVPEELGPVIGIGFSLGARLLIEWAQQSPPNLRGLVLLGIGDRLCEPTDPSPLVDALRHGGHKIGASKTGTPGESELGVRASSFVEHPRALASAGANDPLAIAALLEARGDAPISRLQMQTVSVPTVIIVGSEDPVGRPDRLVGDLTSGDSATISRCDHFALVKSFAAIDHAVRFVDKMAKGLPASG